MAVRLPLSALLSHVLVAFTIDADNEFERRVPHRTSRGPAAGSGRGGWLTSLVMWSNFLRFLGPQGLPREDLKDLARLTNVNGLIRWGYVVLEPDRAAKRRQLIRPTEFGQTAQRVWPPLPGLVEQRWRDRLGGEAVDDLRRTLQDVADAVGIDLPYLPIVNFGDGMRSPSPPRVLPGSVSDTDLGVLASKVLLAFTLEFERKSVLSLAISANVLRVLDATGVRPGDVERLSGISAEAVSASVNFLRRSGLAVVDADPEVRGKRVSLTPAGSLAQEGYRRVLAVVEKRWQERFDTRALRRSLERVVGDGTADPSALFAVVEPFPGGWRAALTTPGRLPQHPMVLHRGGFPDGS